MVFGHFAASSDYPHKVKAYVSILSYYHMFILIFAAGDCH